MSVQRSNAAVPEAAWIKSSYSTGNGGECVEIAATPEAVLVRDSKQSAGPVLAVAPHAWAWLVGLAAGHGV
ncbi:DUF397 domain-containing protein [Streptomyces sp. NPDC001410]|uniref:DUF397 domain-containing protein n=1 Tax=Streptomyces sp. NPDC001410 TaxID=3364574 RepID=UPI00369E7AAF